MTTICAKIRISGKSIKYRILATTCEEVFPDINDCVASTFTYAPGASLNEGDWFKIEKVSQQDFAIDLLKQTYTTLDFSAITRNDFSKIDFLFLTCEGNIFFQNVSKARLVKRKGIVSIGSSYEYKSSLEEIAVNDLPDAIFCASSDTLYFRRLESITSIFKGIDQLYREATAEETAQFLQSDFITLKDGYSADDVKTANRKRIALALKTLSELRASDRSNIFSYIGDYCPGLVSAENTFAVGTEDELKMLLYGIEQRFYTTPVGGEKRIANSVVPLTSS
jgi:hypothetical protein